MVRSYSKHGPTSLFSLISSPLSISLAFPSLPHALLTAALEDVFLWDCKTGVLLRTFHATGVRDAVTTIAISPDRQTLAVGYNDGCIRFFPLSTDTPSVNLTLNGHTKPVLSLCFSPDGAEIVSSSADTAVIVWDLISESGVCRLRGHTAAVSSVLHLGPVIISAAADGTVRVWNVSLAHCQQTILAHSGGNVYSLGFWKEEGWLVSSGNAELKTWAVDLSAFDKISDSTADQTIPSSSTVAPVLRPLGDIPHGSSAKITQVLFDAERALMGVLIGEKTVYIYRLRPEEEVKRKLARRKRRRREKAAASEEKIADESEEEDETTSYWKESIEKYAVVRSHYKLRSFAWSDFTKSTASIVLCTSANSLEVYSVPRPTRGMDGDVECTLVSGVDIAGHRADIRTLSLSSDDELLASGSNGQLKIWNVKTEASLRTMQCGYAVCSAFLPGDRHVLVGTKAGELLLYSIGSSALVGTYQAHDGPVYGMHVRPDKKCVVTGGGDKDVKFWDFGIGEVDGVKQFTLTHSKTLKMQDDILAVQYSPDGRLLAVALMDATVKVFFQDSLKFFLSLYGHKLPVLSMSISSDSKLIVTSSADKNIKIWGLDFGDCHRSIFAHEESIMQVAFEFEGHNFWSVSKDHSLKYWDGDKFENIQKLDGHHGEVWALAVSHKGEFVATGSHDKSIRIWERTDDPLFLEEERERQMEELLEAEDNRRGDMDRIEATDEAGEVSKQTAETMTAGEKISEALEVADETRFALEEFYAQEAIQVSGNPPPVGNPILAALRVTPDKHVLDTVAKISSSSLFDALLVLSFAKVTSFLHYLEMWVMQESNIALVARILFFLLKTHHNTIVSTKTMRTNLISLRDHLRKSLQQQKETIGFNLAAIKYLKRAEEADRTAEFMENNEEMDEEAIRALVKNGIKKRKRIML